MNTSLDKDKVHSFYDHLLILEDRQAKANAVLSQLINDKRKEEEVWYCGVCPMYPRELQLLFLVQDLLDELENDLKEVFKAYAKITCGPTPSELYEKFDPKER